MTSPDIDHDSPTPVWRQVADVLAARIEDGTYTRRIPSEPTLVQEFGVARGTVRRALDDLTERGLIVVVHGKGRYVAER